MLAKSGHHVGLFDRHSFPRFHVGESLVPAVNLTLEKLGVRERMDEIGFPQKHGVQFISPSGPSRPFYCSAVTRQSGNSRRVRFKKWPKQPKNPVSVLHIHGTKDSVIKWKGGWIIGREYPSAKENFENWRKFNKCEKAVDVSKVKIDLAKGVTGKETTITRYKNKDGSVNTEFWQVTGGAHVTPPTKEARERIIKWMLAQSK